MNREKWLTDMGNKLVPHIEKAYKEVTGKEKKMPKWTATVGFPSRGALSTKKRVIGQCWAGLHSKDGTHQVFISPLIHEQMEVVATLAHELVHVIDECKSAHKGIFPKMMKKLGLKGKPTATSAGDEFIKLVEPFIKKMAEKFPHSPLKPNPKFKSQTTRLLKASCEKCGYNVRVTKKWLEVGSPICPTDKIPMYSGIEIGEE
jgi:hypothetical protein